MPLSLKESICRFRKMPRDSAVLAGRAELLAPGDRDLIEAVLVNGQSASGLARIMGVTPRMVRKKIRRLSLHLISRRFLDAARSLPYLPPEEATLARLHFCSGLTQAQLCGRLRLSPHCLRRRLDRLSAQIATISQLQRAAKQEAQSGNWRGDDSAEDQ
jgi:DNA-directed RNA polymerase specialized sigma24 family protein